MSIFQIFILTTAALLLGLLMRNIEKLKRDKDATESVDVNKGESKDPYQDNNDEFYEIARNKRVISLVRVYSYSDLMLMQSMLESAGIKYYVKPNHFGNLYSNSTPTLFSDEIIAILEEDKYEAKILIEEYISTINREYKPKVSAFFSFFLLGVLVSDKQRSSIPELLV